MTHFLRHSAVRLWIALLIGGLGGLAIFPAWQPHLGLAPMPFVAGGVVAGLYAAVGWATNRIGLGRVRRLEREASLNERRGLYDDAEEMLRDALAVMDSFLISPGLRRRRLTPLAARLARFYLAQARLSDAGEEFLAGYLGANPQDEEVAEAWVRGVEKQGGLQEVHQELAARLGSAHPRNPKIQLAVARLYLMLERTDYGALQSYFRVWHADGAAVPEFCQRLAQLLRAEGRADDWAQAVYRQAGLAAPGPAAAGLSPAALRPAAVGRAEPRPAPAEATADGEAFQMRFGADAGEDELEAEPSPWASGRQRVWPACGRLFQAAGVRLRQVAARFASGPQAAARRLRFRPFLRAALIGLLLAAAAAGGLWHVLRRGGLPAAPPVPPPAVSLPAPAPAAVTDPYTLQVAAYLKSEYALKFVEDLKAQGLDAYWIETVSGDKLWYQVRISHFPDQQSARDLGRDLKQKGIIDDFYVTNYSR
jgi:hypothetical protein